jgi:hypothetical protein
MKYKALGARLALCGRGSRNANLQRAEAKNRELIIYRRTAGFDAVTVILPFADNFAAWRSRGGNTRAVVQRLAQGENVD